MNIFTKQILAISAILFLVGCGGRQDMEIHNTVFDKPSSIVITQMDGLENPGFYKEGQQGVVDFLISSAVTKQVTENIKKINVDEIIDQHFVKPFESAFMAKSFKIVKASEKLKKEALVKHEGDQDKCAEFNFKNLQTTYNTEYALVLEPKLFGTMRRYYGFIPLGSPKGYADFKVYLVRLEDNAVLGHYNAESKIEVKGRWDNPPHYEELVKATKTALATALNNAYLHFFVK